MRSSDTLGAIAPALVVALAEIEGVTKAGKNPAFKREGKEMKYATLDAVIEASREVLARHDLVLMQFPGALVGGALTLETVIMHKSGEWVSGDFQIALARTDPQGVGSALTYARRYAQKAALNMPDLDDDAEAAHGRADGRALPPQGRTATDLAIDLLRACKTGDEFKEVWGKNFEGWKAVMSDTDYRRVQTVKVEMVAKLTPATKAGSQIQNKAA